MVINLLHFPMPEIPQTPLENKSTLEQIRHRFDHDVDRFSNLQSGQTSTVDAPLTMALITQAAVAATQPIRHILDIGCGAGNNTLKLLSLVPKAATDLIDLSLPMLQKAEERISAAGGQQIRTFQGDFRTVELESASYDVILAAAVLHHLRDEADWEHAFQKLYDWTAPGGSVWITDLVIQENTAVNQMIWERYGRYLESLGGTAYRDKVFAYIDKEDSPRPVTYQLDLLRRVGFNQVELLHKNSTFAAFGAIKTVDN